MPALLLFPVLINSIQFYYQLKAPNPDRFRTWGHCVVALAFAAIAFGLMLSKPTQQVKWSTEVLEISGPARHRIVWADKPVVREDQNHFLIYPCGGRGTISLNKAACSPELAEFLRTRMPAG